MRDDNNSRQYPPNDPYRRQPAGAGNPQGGDPLAELARLIGQNDPFSDFARDQGHAPPPAFDPRRAPAPSEWTAQQAAAYAQPGPSYRDAPQGRRPEPHQARQPEPHHGYAQSAPVQEDYRTAPEEHHFSDPFGGPASSEAPFAPHDDQQQYASREFAPREPAPREHAAPAAQRGGHNFDPQQFSDPRYGAPAYGDPRGYGDQQQGYPPQGYQPQNAYAQQNSFPPAQGQQGYGSDQYSRGMPHDEDIYEDQPRARRRGGLLTVMAVLTLAVVGTAGAFGYRTLFSGSGSIMTPPTIRADAGPNKVVPTSQTTDPSGKAIYDRVGEKSQTERVVSREEQPVDLKNATPPPRVVLSSGMPNPIAPVPSSPVPPAATPFASPTASVPPANASTEPKKVRTVTIRPDQPAVEAAAQTPVARQASAAEQPIPPANTTVRTTTIRQQPAAAAPSDSNAPLSLTPNSSAPRAAPMRTASAPAARPLTTTSSDSAFAVQVTSQRSEADAQSSFQALQAKYPNVLGSRQAMIRRADLGDKGTYYRAQVPFGSQSEASEFCASLKAAGGQCVVQRN